MLPPTFAYAPPTATSADGAPLLTLHCGGLALSSIAIETPFYVYDLDRIRTNYRRLAAAFQGLDAHLHYSLKANANVAILRALLAEGTGLDAVSGGEIYRALSCGADPARIVFAGVGKTEEELRYALEAGVGCFNVESIGELRRLNQLAAQRGVLARVALRLNPAVQANTHRFIATGHAAAKFGIPEAEAREVLADPQAYPALSLCGIHVHIGSQLGTVAETVEAAAHALRLFADFPALTDLNLGGGFPVPYTGEAYPSVEEFAEGLASLVTSARGGGRLIRLSLEPGRSIVADAGALITTVQYVKHVGAERIVVIDAGMTELIRPMLYGAKHPIVPVRRRDERAGDAALAPAQVVGPVCESTDVMGSDVPLPPLAPGDRLAVLVAGAYGSVMESTYNGRPRVAEVVVEKERWRVVRRRETWAELLALEMDELPEPAPQLRVDGVQKSP